jgi:hypothetical protein
MEQSPAYEIISPSASQEIPLLSWNLKVHYLDHKSPPLVTVLSLTSRAHTVTPHFFKIHTNIILHPCLHLPNDLLPSGYTIKVPNVFLTSGACATCPVHLILLALFALIKYDIVYEHKL